MQRIKKTTRKKAQPKTDWRFGINLEKLSIWLNIASFIFGTLFYLRMCNGMEKTPVVRDRASRDSMLVIDTRLKTELKQIRTAQDSMIKLLQERKTEVAATDKKISASRKILLRSVNGGWNNFSKEEKEAYVNKTMKRLKSMHPD